MTQSALAVAPIVKTPMNVEDTTVLSNMDETYLVGIVEVAHSIIRRHQFFLWARGVLQSLVPHEILLCGYGDWRRLHFAVDKFACKPFPEPMYDEFCGADEGLLAQAHDAWQSSGHVPVVVCSKQSNTGPHPRMAEMIRRHGIENCVFHGVPQVNGSPSVFFCFANLPPQVTRRTMYLVELVAPSLYTAYLRVLHGEGRQDESKTPRAHARPRVALLPRAITGREVQILQWVQEGKSNREIGEVLKISPLTVKNHVQNILKKLKVRNRAQAVSRAIGARLIQSAVSGAAAEKLVRPAQYERDA